jgi:ABC-type transport system substrate-binding protein
MGVVYRAKDPVLNREVAIKLIPPGNLTANAEERFLREAQIVAQMDHPAIVPIYDLGRHEGALFFVMPVLPGTNLRHLLRDGSLRLGDVLDIGTQVAEALDYSHARGIVHRDIKPENVMTSRDDAGHVRARVMDFGLALAASEDRLTKTGTLVGTVSYFSPEQVTSRAFDGRTDTYALGTMLYECLAGEPPFSGEVQTILYRIVNEVPQSLRATGADVSEELESAILQCLEKDPEKRPKKAIHLAEALRRYRGKLHEDEYTRSVMLTASRMVTRPQAAAAPFIGREKETTELQRRLHAAVAGECQFAVVAGEPGIGKTRLVEQLTNLARARKIRVLAGRFVEHDRAFAHQGFCELIQDYFRGREPGSSAASRPDFSDLAGDLLALFPVLGEIGELRAPADGEAAGRAAKAEDKTAIFELLARTLTRLAQGKPLVLVLEELHGAEQSAEALQYVVRRLAPTPTLIVGTYRQNEVEKRHPLVRVLESFRGDPRFVSITLGPLSPSEHRSLVELSAGGGKLNDALASRLYEATEGNPFFTKELVRSLVDSGGIAKDDTGALNLSGAAAISADVLPETIQQAVEARIERLPEDAREILSVASVLGKSFEYRDLEALSEDATGLDESVERLVREGLLEEQRESRGDVLGFASGIVRDVLYGQLSRRKRRSLHKAFAERLESQNAEQLELVYPDLVHHFSQGDVPEKTVDYGLKLAKKSLDAFSPEEAIRLAKTTLEFLEDKAWRGDKALQGEARLLLAEAAHMAGNVDGTLREAEAAVKVFERERRPERSVAAVLVAAESAWQARRIDETRRWVERGIDTAFAANVTAPLAKLLSLAATVANLRGESHKAAAYQAQLERLSSKEKEKTEAEQIAPGGRLVVAMANPAPAEEPALSQTIEEQEILGNVFETLLTTDSEGSLAKGLCEEWSLVDGGRLARLRLRPGVRFSDGTPLTADAVKASLERAVEMRREGTPAALAAVRGFAEYRDGAAPGVAGINVVAEDRLEIELLDPLPIFPALLTDALTAVCRVEPGATNDRQRLVGTGPFVVTRRSSDRIVLEKNPNDWREARPRLDAIEFRTSLTASAIASGLRAGEIELARDLLPQDLEAVLREPRFRGGLVEVPKKNSYFVVFNRAREDGVSSKPAVRRALAGVVRSQDFVWGTLGRFALPATGLIPPGLLGHDPGRRRTLLAREAAAELLASSSVQLPLRLVASVHPNLHDRYRALTDTLFSIWRELGVEVAIGTSTMADYLQSWAEPARFDLMVGRWNADYDDPDDFTFGLFHSKAGLLRNYFSSAATDRLLEEARGETRRAVREGLYRRFEGVLLDDAVIVPLFHDVDYRVASPSVRGLNLRNTPPFVSYREIGKVEIASAPRVGAGGGTITVPIAGVVESLEPTLASITEVAEAIPNVFETLTRHTDGARIVPWLASEVEAEDGGLRYRVRLRRGVRFHDGRGLSARDVRYSLERLLQKKDSFTRMMLSAVNGAKAVLNGASSELSGIHIVSPTELTIDLEKPLSFLPAVLSHPSLAIMPEGTGTLGDHWSRGCVGTGPFRVVRFEPGRRLELERNPQYWREGFPKSDALVFRFGLGPEEIKREFLSGKVSIASDLLPADIEALRHDVRFAAGYQESPRLSTYYVAFNILRGPLRDEALRRRIVEGIDAAAFVRRMLGRVAIPAIGLIPPGLLGYAAGREKAPRSAAAAPAGPAVELTVAVHPVFFGEYAALYAELERSLSRLGFALRTTTAGMAEYQDVSDRGDTDLDIGRWVADYPDTDTFINGMLHSKEGILGRYCGRPETDALAEQGRTESDPSIRHALYRQAEDVVVRDALLVPLFHEQVYRFVRPEVKGLSIGISVPTVNYADLRVRE